MSLQIRPDQRFRVFDVSDPGRLGSILSAGPEQSEVKFDDGAVRFLPNDHLRPVEAPPVVDDELTKSTHPEEAALHRGQAAWQRLQKNSTKEDWIAVGKALAIGRSAAMHDARINKPKGRSYNVAFGAWAKRSGFDGIDKSVRSRLLDVTEHLAEIEAWLLKLPLNEQLQINHPNTIWRRWKAAVKEASGGENSAKRISPMQKLKDELVSVIEERDRYKREIDRGGGDLWTSDDRPQDIARVMLDKLTRAKAERVAREILKALKGEAGGSLRP